MCTAQLYRRNFYGLIAYYIDLSIVLFVREVHCRVHSTTYETAVDLHTAVSIDLQLLTSIVYGTVVDQYSVITSIDIYCIPAVLVRPPASSSGGAKAQGRGILSVVCVPVNSQYRMADDLWLCVPVWVEY